MRAGDLNTGPTRLHEAWKKIRALWEATRQDWQDSVSQQFEEQYLAELEPQIIATLERMRTLAGAFNAANHECER